MCCLHFEYIIQQIVEAENDTKDVLLWEEVISDSYFKWKKSTGH